MGPEDDDLAPPPMPPRLVAVAYLLAATCALAPFALIGAVFAGVVVARRGLPLHGAGVIVLAAVCTALFFVVVR